MQTAIFYGASDDLIEIEGVLGGDEFPAGGEYHNIYMGTFNLGGQIRIHTLFDGCWSFAIGQVDEDIPLPNWPIRITQHEDGYSTRLEIDVPDNIKVFKEKI